MALSPENIRNNVVNAWEVTKHTLGTILRNPGTTGSVLISVALASGVMYGLFGVSEPWRRQQEAEYNARQAAVKQAQADALRRDFKETAGANFLRGESNSMAITLRESSSLASSRTEYLLGVWDRIYRETGCDIGSTTYLEVKPGFLWGQKEPESYAIALTNCPPNRVQLTQ